MSEMRGRDRSEARSLGRGARTLIGFVLTVLLVATQAQFIAGAKPADKEKKGEPAAESSAAAPEESPAPEAPAEEPSVESPPAEAPAEEAPPADEPAEEPAPDPSQPPADDGGDPSGGGENGDGTTGGGDQTGTVPDPSTAVEDPAVGTGDDTAPDVDGEALLRRLNGFRAERALAQPPEPDTAGPPSGSGVQPVFINGNPGCRQLAPTGTTWTELKVEPVASGTYTSGPLTVTVTVRSTTLGQVFDWTANIGIDAVFVKGGNGGNLFSYNEATADTSLHAPVSGTNQRFHDLSHISFCYDVEEKDEPDVEIAKNADLEADPSSGNTFSYTITVTNVGTGTATGVQVTDTFPDGLTVDEDRLPQGCSLDGSTVTCDLGDIDEGDSVSVTIWVTVDENFCGELANTAEVSAENDTNPDNNTSDTVTLNVECQPDVMVEKSAVLEGNPRPGEEFDFSITVTNVGTGTAEDVVLTDVIQPGLVIVDVPENCTIDAETETVTCDLGDIEAGDFVTVTIRVQVAEDFCGPIENTAEVTSPSDSNAENDSDTITFEAVCQPDVSVEKASSVGEIGSGGSFTYTITVTNGGTGTAEEVTLQDDLDDSLQNVQATPSQGSCVIGTGNTLSCQLGDIEQGDSVTITIQVTVPADFCGQLLNQASVAAENDSNRQNNESVLVTVDVPCGPDIDVVKTNDADTDGAFHDEEEALHEGDPVTFKVVITNTGNVAIELDTLLDEYEGISISPDCLTAEGESVLGMVLEPGDQVICFFTVDGYAPEPNGRIVDVVTVVGHDVENPETTVSDFDDSAVTTPEVLPEPPIRPEPPPPGPPPGEVLAATGAELALMGLVALALVLAGIALSYLGRREDETG